ncbi:MAG: L-threonylcarbamoyladenylate synthase [Cephaloticoccus sp.]
MTRRRTTRIYRGTVHNLARLASRLQAGDLVAVPTETVYGLAANALDARACARIFTAKSRPRTDPLIVHLHDVGQLPDVAVPNPTAMRLARAFWPGPLTLILPKTADVPDVVTAGGDSVAVRIPAHPLFRRLLARCRLPLAAPSANPFGYVSPTTAAHVREGLAGKIGYILDGGPARIGLESTIIDARDPQRLRVLRPGAITATQIRRVAGRPVRDFESAAASPSQAQVAPGQLLQHYSPRARVILHDRLPAVTQLPSADNGVAWLYFGRPAGATRHPIHWLSAKGDQTEAAHALFAKLRDLDRRHCQVIHAELAPLGSLALAINDRLRRAAAGA